MSLKCNLLAIFQRKVFKRYLIDKKFLDVRFFEAERSFISLRAGSIMTRQFFLMLKIVNSVQLGNVFSIKTEHAIPTNII